MANTERLHAEVSGGVQGVGFRYFVWQTARQLGLTGWVRNLPNGTVELLAEGPRPQLEQLARAVGSGPPAADVHSCTLRWPPASGEFASFEITF
ncbi:MAG: acylphosphatase [Anaerolineales bacterium]|jgi:acylphosphatase|nr:acylphosphatase [Anaerolineales bacterium]MCW5839300.1 acylphosphatase [Anaerolineales bacterium]MCW5888008.1 acylphosphatase [Anaerolineales bacterium]